MSEWETVKLALCGEGGVGKTSLARVFTGGQFSVAEKITVGISHFTKRVVLEDGRRVLLVINDLGGEKRFKFLAPIFLRGVRGCIFVFDITRPETFEELPRWLDIVYDTVGDIPRVLVGNKVDAGELREVPRWVAEKFAEDRGFIAYYETSAKEGVNVEKPFMELLKRVVGRG